MVNIGGGGFPGGGSGGRSQFGRGGRDSEVECDCPHCSGGYAREEYCYEPDPYDEETHAEREARRAARKKKEREIREAREAEEWAKAQKRAGNANIVTLDSIYF